MVANHYSNEFELVYLYYYLPPTDTSFLGLIVRVNLWNTPHGRGVQKLVAWSDRKFN